MWRLHCKNYVPDPERHSVLNPRFGHLCWDGSADRLNEVKNNIHVRTTLEEINAPLEDLDIVAQRTLEANNWKNNIAQLTKDQVKDLFLSKSSPR